MLWNSCATSLYMIILMFCVSRHCFLCSLRGRYIAKSRKLQPVCLAFLEGQHESSPEHILVCGAPAPLLLLLGLILEDAAVLLHFPLQLVAVCPGHFCLGVPDISLFLLLLRWILQPGHPPCLSSMSFLFTCIDSWYLATKCNPS